MYAFKLDINVIIHDLDSNLTINATLFEQYGNCGYVLKPSFLWDKTEQLFRRFNAYDKNIEGLKPKELTISVSILPNFTYEN